MSILASRQLRSGDLRFTVQNAKQAEILRVHGKEWVKGIGKKAELLLPTWGILVYGIQVRSLGVNSPMNSELAQPEIQRRVIDEMTASNRKDWGDAEITRVSWLVPPKGKTGTAVCEFSSPIPANIAIDRGVLWDGNCLEAALYDRAIRVRQCHTCQAWGHIGTTCPKHLKPRCVHCAGEHMTRKCPAKADGTLVNKCVNCGDAHAAWAINCPARIAEVERVREIAQFRATHHPIPAHFSFAAPSVSDAPPTVSSWGTKPSEGTSSSEGSDSAARSSDREQIQVEIETEMDTSPDFEGSEGLPECAQPSSSAPGLQGSKHAPRTARVRKSISRSATELNDTPQGDRGADQPEITQSQAISSQNQADPGQKQPKSQSSTKSTHRMPTGRIFTDFPETGQSTASARSTAPVRPSPMAVDITDIPDNPEFHAQISSDPAVQTPSESSNSSIGAVTRQAARVRVQNIEAMKKRKKTANSPVDTEATTAKGAYQRDRALSAVDDSNTAKSTRKTRSASSLPTPSVTRKRKADQIEQVDLPDLFGRRSTRNTPHKYGGRARK